MLCEIASNHTINSNNRSAILNILLKNLEFNKNNWLVDYFQDKVLF